MKQHGLRTMVLLILVGGFLIVAPPTMANDEDDLKELYKEFTAGLDDRIEKLLKLAGETDELFEKAAEKLEEDLDKAQEDLAEVEEKYKEECAEIAEKYADEPDKLAEKKAKARADYEKKLLDIKEDIAKAMAKYEKEVAKALSKEGKINPTNVAVTDLDVEFSSMMAQPAAGRIEAVAAHGLSRGAGVLVAVLDGGFNLDAPTIRDHVLPFGYDSVDLDFDVEDFGNGIDDWDDGVVDNAVGHGTFVAGMILMAAPEAFILPVRVVDDEGFGTEFEIAEGIWFATAMGANVINLSLENGTDSGMIKDAIKDAESAGVTVVVSSGDGAYGDLRDVADMDETISVGAVDDFDCLADFTNYEEKKLDVVAPGVDLYGPHGFVDDDAMCLWSGSSFASALVSGGAALLLERHPGWQPWKVREVMIEATDSAYTTSGDPLPYTGRLNLRRVAEK